MGEWATLHSRSMLMGIQRALHERARIEDVEALAHVDWSHDALRNQLLRMRLGFSAGDLSNAVTALGELGSGCTIRKDVIEDALQLQEALRIQRDNEGARAAKR